MANKTISQLTAKTTPADADVLPLEDTEDTKKINYSALADAILNKLTSKTYTVAGSSQTLIAAINALNSKVVATNLPNTIYCVKVGKVCYLTFEHSTAFTAEADATICTLPTGFRPNYAVSFVCPLTGYRISVGISGVISCNHALNENVLRGGITYIISD